MLFFHQRKIGDKNSNNLTHIFTCPQNSPTTAMMAGKSISIHNLVPNSMPSTCRISEITALRVAQHDQTSGMGDTSCAGQQRLQVGDAER